jgi:hypothetical protein
MKQISLSTVMAMLLSVVLVSVVFAAPATAAVQLPLRGVIQANETYSLDLANLQMFVNATGSGNATHLGRFAVNYQVTVDLLTSAGTGASTQLVAANGDAVYAAGSGQGTPTGTPNEFIVVEVYTITGGTGRFAGATGTFVETRRVNIVTGVTSGEIEGTIVLAQGQ